ncbi:putative urocanase [Klebsiella aerogenes]|nr:putative urocanase [Klebsiella aerogenes]
MKRGVRRIWLPIRPAPRSAAWLSAERLELGEYQQKAESDRKVLFWRRNAQWPIHVQAMLAFHEMGVPTFDYGNNIPSDGAGSGRQQCLDFPGASCRRISAAVLPGYRPVPLGSAVRRSQDIYKTDAKVKRSLKMISICTTGWIWRASASVPGLPARICWVGLEWRQKLGLAFNEMVRSGEVPRRS